jgi:hypothetical protein
MGGVDERRGPKGLSFPAAKRRGCWSFHGDSLEHPAVAALPRKDDLRRLRVAAFDRQGKLTQVLVEFMDSASYSVE